MSDQVTQLHPLMQAHFFRTYASVIRIEGGLSCCVLQVFGECPQMYLNAASQDRDPRTQRLLTE